MTKKWHHFTAGMIHPLPQMISSVSEYFNTKTTRIQIRVRDTGQQIGSSLVLLFCLSDRSDSPGIAEPEKWTRCPLNLTLMLFNPSWEYSTFDPRDCRIALIGLKWKKDKTHMIFSTIKSQVSVSDGIGQINKF